MNLGPFTAPGLPVRLPSGRRGAGGRHEGRWRGWTLTFRLAGATLIAGAAVLAVAITGWTPGSIGVLAGAVTALTAMVRGAVRRRWW